MKILITGATGFVGRYVVKELLTHGHEVICFIRDEKKIPLFDWHEKVEIIHCDIHKWNFDINSNSIPDALMHLAWSGLPNYQSTHHLEQNLPGDKKFLKLILDKGVNHILVTGTCFEFGKKNGPLAPNMPTAPDNPYAIAKDNLRNWLEALKRKQEFLLQWVRLFYMYGSGQNPNSILSQLDRAIDNGDPVFNMSGGDQLRDYLPVEEVARCLVNCIEKKDTQGIIHCCSGNPISIRCLVEEHIIKRNAKIKLNLGYYPYPEHEAMEFWGVNNDHN